MKDSYTCSSETEVLIIADDIVSDMGNTIPDEIREDVRQELCLHFLEKPRPIIITMQEIFEIITHMCRSYTGNVVQLPTYSIGIEDFLTCELI